MRIGELARKAGVNIQTIRFYERRRILPAPARSPGGYRLYSESDVVNVNFIRQSQELGFTLTEIRQLLQLHRSAANSTQTEKRTSRADEFSRFAMLKIEQVDKKLEFLRGMRGQLLTMVDQLETSPRCPAPTGPSRRKKIHS